jgi:hypothetical protein
MLSQVTTETSAVILPPGQDPAQILTGNGAEALAAVLASGTRPLADLVTNAELERWTRWLDHPEGQLNALRAVAPVIAAMPPAHVARQVARLSHRLSLDYATVTSAVTSALSEVIVGTARPGTSTSDPWGSSGSGAQPPVHANRSGPGMPAGTSGVSAEQTTPKRDPPSRPASQDPRTRLPSQRYGRGQSGEHRAASPPRIARDAVALTPWARTGPTAPGTLTSRAAHPRGRKSLVAVPCSWRATAGTPAPSRPLPLSDIPQSPETSIPPICPHMAVGARVHGDRGTGRRAAGAAEPRPGRHRQRRPGQPGHSELRSLPMIAATPGRRAG